MLTLRSRRNRKIEVLNEQPLLGCGLLKNMCNEHVSPMCFETKRRAFAALKTAAIGGIFLTTVTDEMEMLRRGPDEDQTAPHQGPMAT